MVRLELKTGAAPDLGGETVYRFRLELGHAAAIGAHQMVMGVIEVAQREARRAPVVHAVDQPGLPQRFKRAVDRRRVQPGQAVHRLVVDLGDRRMAAEVGDGFKDDAALGSDPQPAQTHRLLQSFAAAHSTLPATDCICIIVQAEAGDKTGRRRSAGRRFPDSVRVSTSGDSRMAHPRSNAVRNIWGIPRSTLRFAKLLARNDTRQMRVDVPGLPHPCHSEPRTMVPRAKRSGRGEESPMRGKQQLSPGTEGVARGDGPASNPALAETLYNRSTISDTARCAVPVGCSCRTTRMSSW